MVVKTKSHACYDVIMISGQIFKEVIKVDLIQSIRIRFSALEISTAAAFLFRLQLGKSSVREVDESQRRSRCCEPSDSIESARLHAESNSRFDVILATISLSLNYIILYCSLREPACP